MWELTWITCVLFDVFARLNTISYRGRWWRRQREQCRYIDVKVGETLLSTSESKIKSAIEEKHVCTRIFTKRGRQGERESDTEFCQSLCTFIKVMTSHRSIIFTNWHWKYVVVQHEYGEYLHWWHLASVLESYLSLVNVNVNTEYESTSFTWGISPQPWATFFKIIVSLFDIRCHWTGTVFLSLWFFIFLCVYFVLFVCVLSTSQLLVQHDFENPMNRSHFHKLMMHIMTLIFLHLIVMIRISFNWIGCAYAENVILLI